MRKIELESVRLDAVMNICNASEAVFDAARLAATQMTATYVPAAEVVVFEREAIKPCVVPTNHVLTMTPTGELNIDEWDRNPKPDKPDKPEKPTPPGHDKEKRGPGRPPKNP